MPQIDNIQLRRDSTADWSSTNPVLNEGEPGFGTDTGIVKIGDGSSTWNELPTRSVIDAQKDDYNVHIISGVIRYYDAKPGWDVLENQGQNHAAVNISSVDTSSASIRVNFDQTGWGDDISVSSFVVAPDETLAGEGIFCGATVANDKAEIKLYSGDVSDYVYYTGSAWVSLDGKYTVSWSTDHLELTRLNATSLPGSRAYPQLTARNGGYDVKLGAVTASSIGVYFYDASGTQVTTEDNNMKFFISDANKKTLINPANFTDEYGNLWVLGVILSKDYP